MIQTNLSNLFLEKQRSFDGERGLPINLCQSNFLNFMTEVSGEEKKLNESVFIAGFDEDYCKMENYYLGHLRESFHIEEHFNYPVSNIFDTVELL
jgi:hypothetical protein